MTAAFLASPAPLSKVEVDWGCAGCKNCRVCRWQHGPFCWVRADLDCCCADSFAWGAALTCWDSMLTYVDILSPIRKRQNMLTGWLASTYLHEGSNPPASLNFSWLPWPPAAVFWTSPGVHPRVLGRVQHIIAEDTAIWRGEWKNWQDMADRVANPMLDNQSDYISRSIITFHFWPIFWPIFRHQQISCC